MRHGVDVIPAGRPVISKVTTPSMILIPADLSSVAVVRAALCDALRTSGWAVDCAVRVVLSTAEAVANAVEHGSLDTELIEIVFQVTDHEAMVRVLDSGGARSWLPPAGPPMPPAADAPRGRGLCLMHGLADRVEFRPAGQGTEVRLDFDRHP